MPRLPDRSIAAFALPCLGVVALGLAGCSNAGSYPQAAASGYPAPQPTYTSPTYAAPTGGAAAIPAVEATRPTGDALASAPAGSGSTVWRGSPEVAAPTPGGGVSIYPPAPAAPTPAASYAASAPAAPYAATPTAPAAEPASAGGHVVQPGDTVFSLARRYGVSVTAMQAANALDQAYTIKVGQTLTIPAADGGATTVAYAAPAAPAPTPVAAQPSAPAPKPSAGVGGAPTRLLRPVDGPIVSAFGAPTGAGANDGVDFAAEAGQPVRAAAAGTVAFVSDEASPLGSVVLVQHGGGMVTIYGRIAEVAVQPGQRIAEGAEIARVAAPRGGGDAQLHFELRRGSDPVDPTPYL